MRIPNKVIIRPYQLKIVKNGNSFSKNTPTKNAKDNYFGYLRLDKGTIFLHPSNPKDITVETLVHEILHVIFDIVGLSYFIEELDESSLDEEFLIRSLSPSITAFIKDNPELIKYIQES